jgi:hypothetical protein
VSISASFLWRFLDDVWDLLPSEDRQLFESYWKAQLQIAANLEQKAVEASLSNEISEVPVFLTERWNRFVMDEGTCDLFTQTDSIALTSTTAFSLSRETVFYDTLAVSNGSGQIPYDETMQFFDGSIRGLRYGKIIAGTVSVWLGTQEYTQNRDYAVNLEEGTIQALDDGRIPTNELVTINYQHEEYTKDLDYTLDEVRHKIARTANSAIPNGGTVAVNYTYNATSTLQLEGDKGSVTLTSLTDTTKDFSGLLPNRTLTIKSGPNAGTYSINSVVGSDTIQIAELFVQIQETDVEYSINTFPHGTRIDSNIVSVPYLQDLVGEPTELLIEGIDYRVSGGILAIRTPFPLSALGQESDRLRQVWAETTSVDKETPYRNFGVLIDFYRANSEAYKLALQGLWYTFWTGSTPGNLQRGLHILLGLPFARRAGTVTLVDTDAAQIDITEDSGRVISYTIPSGLDPVIARDDVVARFDKLTTGVQIIDRNNTPGFVASHLGRSGISRYLTDNASRGVGNTDETKALTLLEHHLYLPQVLVEAIEQRVNVVELVTFLENMKPNWTSYVFSFAVSEEEEISLSDESIDFDMSLDLTTTVDNNELNKSFILSVFYAVSYEGQILGSGSQATGNFRDYTKNFTTLGIDGKDFIYIPSGLFKGYHLVLKRIDDNTLSLDIPDAALQTVLNIYYMVLTEEQSRLDHDSVQLRNEHRILPGTDYPTPTTLNTKSDVDPVASGLEDEDVKALLLVDVGLTGDEVQGITDADVALQEFDVPSSPGVVTRDHELASAALKRRNNTTATVTHAYAI